MMTFAGLLAAWEKRDDRYAMRRQNGNPLHLTEDEVSSIRAFRRLEVKDLPESDRNLGQVTLERWTPPVSRR